MHDTDTIAALATAAGDAGIAVIRVSGPQSLRIADRIFRCKHGKPSLHSKGTWAYGHIYDEEQLIDEGLLLIMHAPYSYTREQTVEIQGHGGKVAARRILRAVLRAGARSAEPGEFTKRAFINGRIDLLQAEAVLDLVRAQTERCADSALHQLMGGLSQTIEVLYKDLVLVCADIEAHLDFIEEEIDLATLVQCQRRLERAADRIHNLVRSWESGHLMREGALVVISGRPNVGKSTLLNRLLGKDRAIVSPIPGTTRDTIEEMWNVNGIPIRLTDTAGLRETQCVIEMEGVRRAKQSMAQADINLYVIDASQEDVDKDITTIYSIDTERCLVVINKIDLAEQAYRIDIKGYTTIYVSMKTGEGLDTLRDSVSTKIDHIVEKQSPDNISERHRDLLIKADNEIQVAIEMIKDYGNIEYSIIAFHLQCAIGYLGNINGMTYCEDILDNIFSRFCIGK